MAKNLSKQIQSCKTRIGGTKWKDVSYGTIEFFLFV